MTIEQLRRMHQTRPFHPFRGRTVMIARPDESFEVSSLLLVTSLEPIDGKPHG